MLEGRERMSGAWKHLGWGFGGLGPQEELGGISREKAPLAGAVQDKPWSGREGPVSGHQGGKSW